MAKVGALVLEISVDPDSLVWLMAAIDTLTVDQRARAVAMIDRGESPCSCRVVEKPGELVAHVEFNAWVLTGAA